ncbi:xylose ABC transporter membrane protein [Bacillus sp. OV166]|uniref:sugar ABC transporter permease n=1 Tax=Bacillus sp. OV166 TaxID=1882763 RepID=UPI000A2AA9ED|nr:sugar ABC transporter permease [Bacillus sp. OV166]SMQ87004.1 xylose ABC transporter membrane protein [Bacillus sp. OV166]
METVTKAPQGLDSEKLADIKKKKYDIRAYTMVIGLVVIMILFSFFTDGVFLSARNLSNLAMQMSVVSLLGTGAVLVIVTGNIDLSVGSLVGLSGGIAAAFMAWQGWGTLPTIASVLVFGVIIGIIQGFATVYLNIPAFIVTLGGMMIYRGILLGITKGVTIAPMNNSYQILGQAYINNNVGLFVALIAIVTLVVLAVRKRQSRVKYNFRLESLPLFTSKLILIAGLIAIFVLFMNTYRGIPIPVFFMLVFAILYTFIAEKTKFGRSIYAIGGNIQAATYSGIKVKKVVLIVFALNGLIAAFAGIILSARLNAGVPGAGNMMELDAIAAAVIGGTSLAGGRGRVFGAILGALIMATLDNGMSLLNIDAFWQYIVKGSILVLAVWFDSASKNKKA